MTTITDEFMKAALDKAKPFTVVILKYGPAYDAENVKHLIWEHARRNFALRSEGLLSIVCPIADESDVCGIGIFTVTVDEVKAIMDQDPGVLANIFTYEIHPCRSFPGDALP